MEYNVNIALSFEIIVNSGKVIVFDVIAGVHNNNNNIFIKKHPIKLHIWCYSKNIYWQKKNYNDQDE